jgi:hypothetical protein
MDNVKVQMDLTRDLHVPFTSDFIIMWNKRLKNSNPIITRKICHGGAFTSSAYFRHNIRAAIGDGSPHPTLSIIFVKIIIKREIIILFYSVV